MTRLSGLLVALVIVAAACGGSDTTATTTQAVQTSTAPAPATTATSQPAQTVDAPELAGTSWNVTSYKLPNGAFTNVWKTEVTISFAADGTLSGSAGCNEYGATWSVSGAYDEFESGVPDPNDGQELTLEDLAWTEIACEDSAIMEQEAEILDLIQQGERWVLVRENFNLRDGEGSFLFEATSS